jgi:hypothetical protein
VPLPVQEYPSGYVSTMYVLRKQKRMEKSWKGELHIGSASMMKTGRIRHKKLPDQE